MAHYAKVLNGIVEKVLVAEQDFIDSYVDTSPGEWVQCSYNTRGGKHYDSDGVEDDGTPLRKNYPSPTWLYDGVGFYPPKPYDSWKFNNTTYLWDAPVAYPDSGFYTWNESSKSWDEVTE